VFTVADFAAFTVIEPANDRLIIAPSATPFVPASPKVIVPGAEAVPDDNV